MKKMFSNKKFLAGLSLVVAILTIGTLVFAGQAAITNRQSGTGQSGVTQLYNAVPGTTSAVNTNYAIFDYPMNNVTCDFMTTSATSATATVTVVLNGNLGTSTTLFDATPSLITSTSWVVSTGASVIRTLAKSGVPFRLIQATVTVGSGASASTTTVNCAGVQ